MMKRFTVILFAILSLFSLSAEESATALMERVSAKFQAAKSVTASYSLTSSGESLSGTLTVSGNKYTVTSQALSTWFDGKTQWSYSPAAREVNITEPTVEEQRQVNPFAIITSVNKLYTASYDGAANGRNRKVVLTPKNRKSDITRIVITIDTNTLFPSVISITDRKKRATVIKVSKVSIGGSLPMSTFTWDSKKYRGVEVVDLR